MLDPSNSCLANGGLGLARHFVDRRLGLFNRVLRHILGGFSGLLSAVPFFGLLRDLGGLLRELLRIKPLLDRLDGPGHLLAGGFDVGGDHLRVASAAEPEVPPLPLSARTCDVLT